MLNAHACKLGLVAAALAGALCGPAAAQSMSIIAPAAFVPAGTPVTLDVRIENITDLFAWQFSLAFNPAVLQVTSVTEGSFLSGSGAGTLFGGGTVDNSAGTISFAYDTLIGQVPGVSGFGVLARVNANVLAGGSSPLSFSNTIFLDSALADITVTVTNGVLLAVPEPAAFWLLGAGLAGIAALRRRQAA